MINFEELSTTRSELAVVLSDLREDEGLKLEVYKDTTGHQTIGYGHNLSDLGISKAIADAILMEDLVTTLMALNSQIPWWKTLTESQRRALINMAFNLGVNKLLEFKKMLAALKTGNSDLAATEALDSKWAEQVGSRAWRIAALFRNTN